MHLGDIDLGNMNKLRHVHLDKQICRQHFAATSVDTVFTTKQLSVWFIKLLFGHNPGTTNDPEDPQRTWTYTDK